MHPALLKIHPIKVVVERLLSCFSRGGLLAGVTHRI
jgi:hypothetical protein